MFWYYCFISYFIKYSASSSYMTHTFNLCWVYAGHFFFFADCPWFGTFYKSRHILKINIKYVAYSSQGCHTDQLDFCNWLSEGSAKGFSVSWITIWSSARSKVFKCVMDTTCRSFFVITTLWFFVGASLACNRPSQLQLGALLLMML